MNSIALLLEQSNSLPDLRNFLTELQRGQLAKVAQQRIAVLKNRDIDDDVETPEDRKRAEIARQARKDLLPVPQCVQDILTGNYVYISDGHKRLIQDCVPWTIQALKYAYLDPEIKKNVRLLLGTFQFTQCLSWAQPSWPKLMSGLRTQMLAIGRQLKDIYEGDNLREILGTLEPPLLERTNGRQDCPGGKTNLLSMACEVHGRVW